MPMPIAIVAIISTKLTAQTVIAPKTFATPRPYSVRTATSKYSNRIGPVK